jgi:hypothetical protein
LQNKVFKIIADQASNNKKAFATEKQCEQSDDIIKMTNELLQQQIKSDLAAKNEILRKKIDEEIEEFNAVDTATSLSSNKKRKREEILLDDFNSDEFEEDYTDNTSIDGDESLNDAENFDDLVHDFLMEEHLDLAYIPCLAHNIQLVIKDGLKLNKQYEALIKHVSEDIVTKSKSSLIIAEELRKLNVKLNKKNVTRWNSILFMIRSALKLSPDEYKKIRAEMPTKTIEQKEIMRKFSLSATEREMLEELKEILEAFEFVTDELQSNRINISRVYPGITFIRKKLDGKDNIYTQKLREDLLESLDKRFNDLMNDDALIYSTLLDPNFGLTYFELEKQTTVRARILAKLKRDEATRQVRLLQFVLLFNKSLIFR